MNDGRLIGQEVFQFLRSDQVNAISEHAEVVDHAAGDTVYYKGAKAEYFFVVLEGQVALRLPGTHGVSVLIDEVGKGAVFGSCVCFDLQSYTLTAQCSEPSKLLKIDAIVLKEMMDNDLLMGFAIQSRISQIYFKRYIETMKKLQAIVINLPIDTA
jgi:CRP-like cAMP-binding protein